MSDLVERLREYARNCGGPPEEYLTWQAADEIERLRIQRVVEGVAAFQINEELRAEIDRLRAAR